MRNFHDRIGEADCGQIWQAAWQRSLVTEETKAWLVHDLGRLRSRLQILTAAFPPQTLHAVAIKANPLVEILKVVVDAGAGLEAASLEEVKLALAAGCPPARIVFDSPAKTVSEIQEALQLGIILNANSLDELERIDSLYSPANSSSRIGLRVNPEVGSGAIALTGVGASGTKFGVSLHGQRGAIVEAFHRWPWLVGLHVHIGSQGCLLSQLVQGATRLELLRQEIEISANRPLEFVDIGGGLPTIYGAGQQPPTPADYVAALADATPSLLCGPPLVTEFGRSLQAGCGLTFSRVEYVTHEGRLAVVHVGADLLLRPVYAPQDWQHEFFVLGADGQPKTGDVRDICIAGPLCFAGDILARDIPLPAVAAGDWIVIRDTGAYTLSMWSRHCSRGLPLVLGYDATAAAPVRVLRPAESPSEVVEFWSSRP